MVEWEGGVQIAMQCFAVWIAMQFVHACYLNLFLQFQCLIQRSRKEAPQAGQKVALILVLEEGSPIE